MYGVDVLDSEVEQDTSGLHGPIDDVHVRSGVDVVVRHDEGGAVPLVTAVLAVREDITDQGGGDAGGSVFTAEVSWLLHVWVEVESPVGHLVPWLPGVGAVRGQEIPRVNTEGETGCTTVEVEVVGVGHNLSQLEDVDDVPPAGILIKYNLAIDISSDIVSIIQNIESVNIDMGTNSLDINKLNSILRI